MIALDVLETIALRASAKEDRYDWHRPVEEWKIQRVLEAGRWAPSSRNLQPWRFLVITDAATRELMKAKAGHEGNLWIFDCPVNIVVAVGPTSHVLDPRSPALWFDAGLACQNMLLAATALGLACCPTGGWTPHGMIQALQLPSYLHPVCMICMGYPASGDLERFLRGRRPLRNRLPLEQIVINVPSAGL